MNSIILLDTSIYLNILDIPGRNQKRDDIINQFREYIENGAAFLLPMATIWETGSHISRLKDGGLRREYAVKLVKNVQQAIQGEAPYSPTCFPSQEVFLE